jgi:phosphohistidine phosphatase
MKTLYLLRHAKSSRDDSSLPDRERPLEARGERDAEKMSKRWSHVTKKPDLIVSSPAARAVATAKVFAAALGYEITRVKVDDRLYGADVGTLVTIVEALDDKLKRVMLVGHNPGFAELAHHFDDEISQMPTCALAELRFDAASWVGIGQAKPERTVFDSPRLLSK